MESLIRHTVQYSFDIQDIKIIKEKVLRFASNCDTFSYLDNNQYSINPNRYELLVGLDIHQLVDGISAPQGDWLMGLLHFEYRPTSTIESNDLSHAYIPQTVISIAHEQSVLEVSTYLPDAQVILDCILQMESIPPFEAITNTTFESSISENEYLQNVQRIKEDIYYGKYYEINYCIQYKSVIETLNPVSLFHYQNQLNPSPMAAFYKYGNRYLICTSPERFLYKSNQQIYCQPIKGTAPKGNGDQQLIKKELLYSEKDRAENVMIVDLTRSDLAKCCIVNSVNVSELFGIYEFPYVYQMISTIQGNLWPHLQWADVVNLTYPMGSMTGAPKPTVITHIEKYETVNRGMYSGTLFYINPDGDWDSNVVIRSLVYEPNQSLLHFHVGSAITYDSIPEQEWEELQWKAMSMKKVLASS